VTTPPRKAALQRSLFLPTPTSSAPALAALFPPFLALLFAHRATTPAPPSSLPFRRVGFLGHSEEQDRRSSTEYCGQKSSSCLGLIIIHCYLSPSMIMPGAMRECARVRKVVKADPFHFVTFAPHT